MTPRGGRGAWEKPLVKNRENAEERHSSVTNQPDFSSSDDDSEDGQYDTEKLQASIFSGYPSRSSSNESQIFQTGVSRISNLVVATKSGATSCLICLEKVRKVDPIWHCNEGCFAVLHLICIQSWARQALSTAAESSAARQQRPGEAASWHCPKCRRDYPQSDIPREYRCYCGKEVEPEPDPWLIPHTCGERCERRLGVCMHTCMLLCHPGPCPPCPQLVQLKCHCGKVTELLRCGQKSFSCKRLCNRALACGVHKCEEVCHEGDCKPCNKAGLHSCRCGYLSQVRPCSEADYQCDRICETQLNCKKHLCGKRCHSGPCGECELQGRRTCPCGKQEYKELSCDEKAPTCGSTCEKLLYCGLHRCPERCHLGSCIGTCRNLTNKSCRCGSLKKEVPCFQDLVCERRCQSMRNCQRHACKKRCCDGDCPPCPEICGRKLRCGNHKCPAPCHRGLCAPCPLTVKLSCACGYTTIEVPCGADRDARPPKCFKPCQIPQVCGHGNQCKPHRCHYGPCPPCQMVCNKQLSCGHLCTRKCHGARPVSVPFKATKRDRKVVYTPSAGSPCPPCSELVSKECMGKHPEGVKLVPCTDESQFSCERSCGNVLSCGNHYCQEPCHVVTIRRTLSSVADMIIDGTQVTQYDSCSSCRLKCAKKRNPPCQHPCEIGCHPGNCPPCKAPLKKSCHCGTLVRTVECNAFNGLSEAEKLEFLSCKGPCHRKLENCTHMCSEVCHPGPCPQVCQKKVTVRCSCQRLRKVWQCLEVQAAREKSRPSVLRNDSFVGILKCDEECSKAAKAGSDREQVSHKGKIHDSTEEVKKQPKTRKGRGAHRNNHGSSKYKEAFASGMKWTLVLGLVLLAAAILYYGAVGLHSLSDWMNEIDTQRPRRRLH